MSYLSAFEAVGLLWGKKRPVEEIDPSFCIEQICGSAYGCSDNAIAKAELVSQFGTNGNDRHVRRKWKLFDIAYR